MRTRIQHLAIVSENFPREAKFYEAVFGMKRSKPGSPEEEKAIRQNAALSIGDGYVGVTVIGRKPGYVPGLHHFGIDVDDVEEATARIRRRFPGVAVLKRPSNRPFATLGAHDPEGNFFDLTQEGMENRSDVYVEKQRTQPRRIRHFKLRVMNAPLIAAFYRDLFDLTEEEKASEDPNYYLTDGRVTLVIAPWRMADYAGAGIDGPGLEHVGFEVESVAAVEKDIAALRAADPEMHERVIFVSEEAARRDALIAGCRYARRHLSDPDGIFIDVGEAPPG